MSKANPKSVNGLFTELDTIVEWFSSDDVDLESSLDKYERGLEIIQDLEKKLDTIDTKLETIHQKFKQSNS